MRTKKINSAIAYVMNAMKRSEGVIRIAQQDALRRLIKARNYDKGGMHTSADVCLLDALQLLIATRS